MLKRPRSSRYYFPREMRLGTGPHVAVRRFLCSQSLRMRCLRIEPGSFCLVKRRPVDGRPIKAAVDEKGDSSDLGGAKLWLQLQRFCLLG